MSAPEFSRLVNTRVAVASSLSSPLSVTMAELSGATEVTDYLPMPEGLTIEPQASIETFTPWHGQLTRSVPTHYGLSVALTSYRPTQAGSNPVWDLAVFQDPVALIVREGLPSTTPWAPGQIVEVVVGRWGIRRRVPDPLSLFTVSIEPLSHNDDATVVA